MIRTGAVGSDADQLPPVGRRLPAGPALAAARACSRRWRTTCGACCARRHGRGRSRRRRSSTAARCSRRPRAAAAPATTAPSSRRARRCMPPSTRWAICWRCTSRRPTSRTGPRSATGRRRPGVTGESGRAGATSTRATPARRRPRRPGRTGSAGSGQAPRGQARLRAAAAPLGGRAELRAGPPASAASPATTSACPRPLAGLHLLAFVTLMLRQVALLQSA